MKRVGEAARKLSLLVATGTMAFAAPDAEFFEKKIRPVLASRCFACHSSKMKAPMGGLVLDTKAGTHEAIASGKLLKAIGFNDPSLQMPPTGKLPAAVITDFEQWIAAGAADPRADAPAPTAALTGMSVEKGRRWWAFQPLRQTEAPATKWGRTRVDGFVFAQLEKAKLQPSPEADPKTLLRRVYFDLTGLKPSFDELDAFARGGSSYEEVVDQLLASPRYGERWGRYWLDVARYAEDNPTSEATNQPYPYAWRYRDWVFDAVNKDVPYDRFVKLQLAADLLPDAKRSDLAALGYLGAAPVYHKDARLSKDVIETLAADDWDERVDAVSRGLLGLSVACARCHDHKFDPIPTKDYYGLASVFASSTAVERPVREIEPDLERRFLWVQQRLVHLEYLARLLTGEPGTKPEASKKKAAVFRAEITDLHAEMKQMGAKYPELGEYLTRFAPRKPGATGRPEPRPADTPFFHAVYDAGMWIDGSDPDLTMMDIRPGTPRDLPVFLRGSVSSPGDPAPRRFLSVLSGAKFTQGSGRRELAERLFDEGAPLAARVIVNRVWGWHFGKPLVPTASDFGTQGDPPTHPELLDDLAARFVANGWSMKWLHRELLLSATYRQASHTRADAEQADPTNRLLWRMMPRRLDIEAFRDEILQATETLDLTPGGPSAELDAPGNTRRTVYARVSRSRLNALLRLYDFPDASQHSPTRDLTTTPLQQLFVMNSAFLQEQAALLAKAVRPLHPRDQILALYRRVLSRDPSPKELDLAFSYLAQAPLEQYAQALLSTNEFIFWP